MGMNGKVNTGCVKLDVIDLARIPPGGQKGVTNALLLQFPRWLGRRRVRAVVVDGGAQNLSRGVMREGVRTVGDLRLTTA
jgi:hypothetical protein